MATLYITIRFKWWLIPYIKCLIFFCKLTGQQPDQTKLEKIIKKAMYVGKNATTSR